MKNKKKFRIALDIALVSLAVMALGCPLIQDDQATQADTASENSKE